MPRFLHVGCGKKHKPQTTRGFNTPDWQEIRLDIDPAVAPDIVGTITDMSGVGDGTVDGLFSSHNIEHVFPHEVPIVLREFRRVLSSTGFAVITCPDLKSVARLVADDKLMDAAYMSGMGPITPLDILYGHRASIQAGNVYMAHRGGFTLKTLLSALTAAGFASVAGLERPKVFDLWAIGTRDVRTADELRGLLMSQLPASPPPRGLDNAQAARK
jgi:hypothetical protein